MPSFSLGTVMVIACLEIFKATGPSGSKEGKTNISLVPFCIHYEHTDACPRATLALFMSVMHRSC